MKILKFVRKYWILFFAFGLMAFWIGDPLDLATGGIAQIMQMISLSLVILINFNKILKIVGI